MLGERSRAIPSAWGWLSGIKINLHLLRTFPMSGIFHALFHLHGKRERRIRVPTLQLKKKDLRQEVTARGLQASKWQNEDAKGKACAGFPAVLKASWGRKLGDWALPRRSWYYWRSTRTSLRWGDIP